MIGRARLNIGRQYTQGAHIFVVCLNVFCRDITDRFPGLDSGRIDLVINVREISGKCKFVIASQKPCEQIKYDCWPRIANMRIVVNGWPTEIHRDLASDLRFKRYFLTP